MSTARAFARNVAALASEAVQDARLLEDHDSLVAIPKSQRRKLYAKVWEWIDENGLAEEVSEVQDFTSERSRHLILVVPLNPCALPFVMSNANPEFWGARPDDHTTMSEPPKGMQRNEIHSSEAEAPLARWRSENSPLAAQFRKAAAGGHSSHSQLWAMLADSFAKLCRDLRSPTRSLAR